jgi:hypothetical protein
MREGGGSVLRQSGRIVASRRPPGASPLSSVTFAPAWGEGRDKVARRRGGLASVHFAGAAKRQSGWRNDGRPHAAAQEIVHHRRSQRDQ